MTERERHREGERCGEGKFSLLKGSLVLKGSTASCCRFWGSYNGKTARLCLHMEYPLNLIQYQQTYSCVTLKAAQHLWVMVIHAQKCVNIPFVYFCSEADLQVSLVLISVFINHNFQRYTFTQTLAARIHLSGSSLKQAVGCFNVTIRRWTNSSSTPLGTTVTTSCPSPVLTLLMILILRMTWNKGF